MVSAKGFKLAPKGTLDGVANCVSASRGPIFTDSESSVRALSECAPSTTNLRDDPQKKSQKTVIDWSRSQNSKKRLVVDAPDLEASRN